MHEGSILSNLPASLGRKVVNLNRSAISNVVLLGGTGSGKSSVAVHLAKLLGFGLFDTDSRLEARAGKKISDIFAEQGESGFRSLETELLISIGNIKNHVIVTGAGLVEMEQNRKLLKNLGPAVWLATPVESVVARLIMKPDELLSRPLLAPAVEIEDEDKRREFILKKLDSMLLARVSYYEEAEVVICSSYATAVDIAVQIKAQLCNFSEIDL